MKMKRGLITLFVLFVLMGPCAYAVMTDMAPTATPTTEAAELLTRARPQKGQRLSIDGWAAGYKFNFAGKFNWRGRYKGPYIADRYISTQYAYVKNGAAYYPAVSQRGKFLGWYVRDKDTVKRVTWKDSQVHLR